MRTISFNELKLKNVEDEESFYQFYLKNLQNDINDYSISFCCPEKQYEIFYLDILGGKIILLNKNYINSESKIEQELFFDYKIALQIYNLMLDIVDGIDAEQNEMIELYKDERLQEAKEIENLKEQDERIFQEKKQEYNLIINSNVYKDYIKLKEENEKLKSENKKLAEQIDNIVLQKQQKNNNISFFQQFLNKLKNKRLPKE